MHPLAVADIFGTLQIDHITLMAALMHDVVGYIIFQGDLEEMFGSEVAFLVDGVTKLNQFQYETKKIGKWKIVGDSFIHGERRCAASLLLN